MQEEKSELGLKCKKNENFSEWYNELVLKAELADYAPISGCMVIRPYGFAVWENIQRWFDTQIQKTGHRNAYFPLFIPERFLHKEAEHFKGFQPEVAFIERKDPSEERYALRPTSETIIYDSYSKWIRSWRDLPLLLNQWCNIIRWETTATRLFLRTREFLWQEGHTVHAAKEEADKEVMDILKVYVNLMENVLAIPVLVGRRTENDKFPGALYTMALESLMPDGRSLQMGTSHNLGQNFSRPFGIKFKDRDEKDKYVWQTSWGFSTRLIGAIVMTHGDDKGLIMPPEIAPVQAVIIPIIFEKDKKTTLQEAEKLGDKLSKKFRVELDKREEYSAGWKFNDWEMKGVPVRIEIGPKDIEKKQVIAVRRDTGEKIAIKISMIENKLEDLLKSIQKNLLAHAKRLLTEDIKIAKNAKELKQFIENRKMIKAGWCGSVDCENKIQNETTATIRLIPLKSEKGPAVCVYCGKKSREVVYIAKAY